MSALFYGNKDNDVRSTEVDWADDEEFNILELDKKEFELNLNLNDKTSINNSTNVFISFFEQNEILIKNSLSIPLGIVKIGKLSSKHLNGLIYKLSDDTIWFSLSNLEKLPCRSFISRLIENLCSELFTKLLLTNQTIYLLSQHSSFDNQFEYYTNDQIINNNLKSYQITDLPIMFTKASEGLLFEYLIKNNKKIHLFKLPMILDEIEILKSILPKSLYNQLNIKNNYLITSSNLYA